MKQLTKSYVDQISRAVIGAAIEVHKELGPGLLENLYEECLIFELRKRGYRVDAQEEVPVYYKGNLMRTRYRYDILVEDLSLIHI